MTLGDLLAAAWVKTRAAHPPSGDGLDPSTPSRREAALILGHLLGLSEAQILVHDRDPVAPVVRERFEALWARRLRGEPIAYLTGEREFYGRPIFVDGRVLIPRPETELLVEEALRLELPPAPLLLDIGTGSGCLAITLACELETACVFATDLSPAALAVARRNILRHAVEHRTALIATDLAAGLDLRDVALVVSNPPYVPQSEIARLPITVRGFEPAEALFAADDGTATIARLLDGLDALTPGTHVLVEIGAGQAAAVRRLVAHRPFRLHRVRPDYAGIPRVAVLTRHAGG